MVTQKMITNLREKAMTLYMEGRYTLSWEYGNAAILLQDQLRYQRVRREQSEIGDTLDWLDHQAEVNHMRGCGMMA